MIGVIGDLHLKESLSYADFIVDRRIAEREEILDFIVDSFKDCKYIVFLGDNLHLKNNPSEVNRKFVELVERFSDKEVFIIVGNHEKRGDGKTAIDFLAEVKKPNWHIFTKPGTFPLPGLKLDFLPFMTKHELKVETTKEASAEIMERLHKDLRGDILFTHHMVSDTTTFSELADEPVLPKKELEEYYSLILAGHIHKSGRFGRTILCGSVFTDTVNENGKKIWKIKEDRTVEEIPLPGREIHKVADPTVSVLAVIPKESIVKIVLTDKNINAEEIRKEAERFDAHLIVEDYPHERKKMHIEGGAMDFSIENLLSMYSKERDVPLEKLRKGLELIR